MADKVEQFKDQIEQLSYEQLIKLENVLSNKIILDSNIRGGKGVFGSGAKCFRFDEELGIWLGAAKYSNAPFRVSLEGAVTATSITLTGASIDGTSTIGGRTASVLASAIDASGHFADDAIDTASSTILDPFTFGASGAIQIGTYVNGVTGDLKLSPSGILARNSAGATTFSINGETGVAVLNGLIVGTNVGIGTAQNSAGVTTIIGDTVITSFVNALSVVAGSVAAENITGTTITGKTIRTSAGTARVEMDATQNALIVYYNNIERAYLSSGVVGFISAGGSAAGEIMGLGAANLGIIAGTDLGVQLQRSGANAGDFFPSAGDTINLGTSSNKWQHLYLSGSIVVGGTVDGVDIATHRSRHYAGGSDPVIITYQSSGSNLGISSGWAYTHDNNASAHHTKYTDANARSGVTGTALPGNLVLGNHEINDVSYLKFDSSYGKIYKGATEILDFISTTSLECNVPFRLANRSSSPGSAQEGWMFFHTTYDEVWIFRNGSWKALAYVA